MPTALVRSAYNDPAFQNHGFVNHIHHVVKDMGVYPNDPTQPLIELYKIEMISNLQSTSGTGAKPRNLALFRKVLAPHASPTSGSWILIDMWSEGINYDDAAAAGTVDVLPDGTVHIVMSFGKLNTEGKMTYQPWEAAVPRTFAPPIVRPPTGQGPKGDPGVKGDKGDKGDPGPKGDPGSGGATDTLWEGVRKALKAWLSA